MNVSSINYIRTIIVHAFQNHIYQEPTSKQVCHRSWVHRCLKLSAFVILALLNQHVFVLIGISHDSVMGCLVNFSIIVIGAN